MKISKEQLAGKPREIGQLDGEPVMETATKGGLHMVFAVKKNGGTVTLGMGSHKAIARHVAQKENPAIHFSELSKSEDLPMWLAEELAKSEDAYGLTAAVRELE